MLSLLYNSSAKSLETLSRAICPCTLSLSLSLRARLTHMFSSKHCKDQCPSDLVSRLRQANVCLLSLGADSPITHPSCCLQRHEAMLQTCKMAPNGPPVATWQRTLHAVACSMLKPQAPCNAMPSMAACKSSLPSLALKRFMFRACSAGTCACNSNEQRAPMQSARPTDSTKT